MPAWNTINADGEYFYGGSASDETAWREALGAATELLSHSPHLRITVSVDNVTVTIHPASVGDAWEDVAMTIVALDRLSEAILATF